MTLRNPICFLRTVWRSIKYGKNVCGCSFRTSDIETPPNIHILECDVCGRESFMWSWDSLEDYK